ncbi:MAG: FAD-binding oxidoreductase [Spirochaetaceae bacterium]
MTADHESRLEHIARSLDRLTRTGERPRIYRGGTNSTRGPDEGQQAAVDLRGLDRVLAVEAESRQAVVEPNVSMRQLVTETIRHGLVPPVVMEFPEITVGGGIAGGAGESSSFRYGLFHNTVRECELVLGDGRITRASEDVNPELFEALPGSLGTLGVLTATRVELIPAQPFVELTYRRVGTYGEALETLAQACLGAAGDQDGRVDFCDAIMYEPSFGVVMTGRLADRAEGPVRRFSRAPNEWLYLHARHLGHARAQSIEYVPLVDYLFRYDRGAFWAGRFAFRVLRLPFVRPLRFLLDGILDTHTLYAALHASGFSYRYLVQDVCLPRGNAEAFLSWVDGHLGIRPLWLWPIRPDPNAWLSPAHIDTDLVVDVGVWGVPRGDFLRANRAIEEKALELDGRKMLYAHVYRPEEEFWSVYDRDRYNALRCAYRAEGAFPSLYEKVRTDPPGQRGPSVIRGGCGILRDRLSRA